MGKLFCFYIQFKCMYIYTWFNLNCFAKINIDFLFESIILINIVNIFVIKFAIITYCYQSNDFCFFVCIYLDLLFQ